jgi:hypothetical protein
MTHRVGVFLVVDADNHMSPCVQCFFSQSASKVIAGGKGVVLQNVKIDLCHGCSYFVALVD